MSVIANFDLDQGATKHLTFTLHTDSGGTPLDLTGYDVRLYVKRFRDQEAALISKEAVDMDITPASGIIELSFDPADTADLVFGFDADGKQSLYYDLEIESPGGVVRRPFRGTITLLRNVTVE